MGGSRPTRDVGSGKRRRPEVYTADGGSDFDFSEDVSGDLQLGNVAETDEEIEGEHEANDVEHAPLLHQQPQRRPAASCGQGSRQQQRVGQQEEARLSPRKPAKPAELVAQGEEDKDLLVLFEVNGVLHSYCQRSEYERMAPQQLQEKLRPSSALSALADLAQRQGSGIRLGVCSIHGPDIVRRAVAYLNGQLLDQERHEDADGGRSSSGNGSGGHEGGRAEQRLVFEVVLSSKDARKGAGAGGKLKHHTVARKVMHNFRDPSRVLLVTPLHKQGIEAGLDCPLATLQIPALTRAACVTSVDDKATVNDNASVDGNASIDGNACVEGDIGGPNTNPMGMRRKGQRKQAAVCLGVLVEALQAIAEKGLAHCSAHALAPVLATVLKHLSPKDKTPGWQPTASAAAAEIEKRLGKATHEGMLPNDCDMGIAATSTSGDGQQQCEDDGMQQQQFEEDDVQQQRSPKRQRTSPRENQPGDEAGLSLNGDGVGSSGGGGSGFLLDVFIDVPSKERQQLHLSDPPAVGGRPAAAAELPLPATATAGPRLAAAAAADVLQDTRLFLQPQRDAAAAAATAVAPAPPRKGSRASVAAAAAEQRREGSGRGTVPLHKLPCLSALHHEVTRFAAASLPTRLEMEAVRAAVEGVEQAVVPLFPNARVLLFGSQATGLALPGSDLDIVILGAASEGEGDANTPSSAVASRPRGAATGYHRRERALIAEVLEEVLDSLIRAGLVAGRAQVINAKVPIIKCKLLVTVGGASTSAGGGAGAGAAPESTATHLLDVDISLGVENGADAVHFIARQIEAIPPLRSLIMVLKAFLKEAGMNEVFTGGLSSYSLVNMAIAHMQAEGYEADLRHQEMDLGPHNLGFVQRLLQQAEEAEHLGMDRPPVNRVPIIAEVQPAIQQQQQMQQQQQLCEYTDEQLHQWLAAQQAELYRASAAHQKAKELLKQGCSDKHYTRTAKALSKKDAQEQLRQTKEVYYAALASVRGVTLEIERRTKQAQEAEPQRPQPQPDSSHSPPTAATDAAAIITPQGHPSGNQVYQQQPDPRGRQQQQQQPSLLEQQQQQMHCELHCGLQVDYGVLLWGFFDRFGRRFQATKDAVAVRRGGICMKDKAWRQKQRPWLVAVEDPQEVGRDICSGSFNSKSIQQAFAAAADQLQMAVVAQCDGSGGPDPTLAPSPSNTPAAGPSAGGEAAEAATWAAVQADGLSRSRLPSAIYVPGTSFTTGNSGGIGSGGCGGMALLSTIVDVRLAIGRCNQSAMARAALGDKADKDRKSAELVRQQYKESGGGSGSRGSKKRGAPSVSPADAPPVKSHKAGKFAAAKHRASQVRAGVPPPSTFQPPGAGKKAKKQKQKQQYLEQQHGGVTGKGKKRQQAGKGHGQSGKQGEGGQHQGGGGGGPAAGGAGGARRRGPLVRGAKKQRHAKKEKKKA